VVIADIKPENGNRTVDMVKAVNGQAIFVQTDVSKAPSAENMVKETLRAYGKIDILVNSAAVFVEATVLNTSEEDWDRIMAINLKGIFFCCKYASLR